MLNRPCLLLTLFNPSGEIQFSRFSKAVFSFKNLIWGRWAKDYLTLKIPAACSVESQGKSIYKEVEISPSEIVLRIPEISKEFEILFKNKYRLRVEQTEDLPWNFNFLFFILPTVVLFHLLSIQLLSFNFNVRREVANKKNSIESVNLVNLKSNDKKLDSMGSAGLSGKSQVTSDSLFKKWSIRKAANIFAAKDINEDIGIKGQREAELIGLLSQRKSQIRECYRQSDLNDESHEAQFNFNSAGLIQSVSFATNSTKYKLFAECLKQALSEKLRFNNISRNNASFKIVQTLIFKD